jgi:molybdate transport system substrate-binding protein
MELNTATPVEIKGISSMAMRQALAAHCNNFQFEFRLPVDIVSVGGLDAVRRIKQREPFDFAVLSAEALQELAADGHVDSATRVDVADSRTAIAVAADTLRPDISTETAIRDAVFRVDSIGVSTGPSGTHIKNLLERWGGAGRSAPRIVCPPPGTPIGALVARGEVALGFQQLSELMDIPGIDIVGLLPPEIQCVTTFSAALCASSRHRVAGQAFLAYLVSPKACEVTRQHGMEPHR